GLSKRTGRDHYITSELEWFSTMARLRVPSLPSAPVIPSFRDRLLNRNTDCSLLAWPAGGTALEAIAEGLPPRSRQSQCGANFWFENPHQVRIPTDEIVRNVKHDHLRCVFPAELLVNVAMMRIFHYADDVGFLEQLLSYLVFCPAFGSGRRDPHGSAHLRQHHRRGRAAIQIPGTNHQNFLHNLQGPPAI